MLKSILPGDPLLVKSNKNTLAALSFSESYYGYRLRDPSSHVRAFALAPPSITSHPLVKARFGTEPGLPHALQVEQQCNEDDAKRCFAYSKPFHSYGFCLLAEQAAPLLHLCVRGDFNKFHFVAYGYACLSKRRY